MKQELYYIQVVVNTYDEHMGDKLLLVLEKKRVSASDFFLADGTTWKMGHRNYKQVIVSEVE